jgi:hypothetical protein
MTRASAFMAAKGSMSSSRNLRSRSRDVTSSDGANFISESLTAQISYLNHSVMPDAELATNKVLQDICARKRRCGNERYCNDPPLAEKPRISQCIKVLRLPS